MLIKAETKSPTPFRRLLESKMERDIPVVFSLSEALYVASTLPVALWPADQDIGTADVSIFSRTHLVAITLNQRVTFINISPDLIFQ